MATLAAGSSTSFTLAWGQSVRIQTSHNVSGRIKFIPSNPESPFSKSSGRSFGPLSIDQTFGPWDQSGTVIIENDSISSASITYSFVVTGQYSNNGSSVIVSNPSTFVVLGDSRIAYGKTDDPANGKYFDLAQSWVNHLSAKLAGRLTLLGNAGVSGNNSSEMLARLQSDVIALGPEWCFMMSTVNDISTAKAITLSQQITNITTIYQQLAAAGIKFAIATIGPWFNMSPSVSPLTNAQKAQRSQYNAWLKDFCQKNNIPCIDEYAYVADPATGLAVTNAVINVSTDAHYSDYGSGLVGNGWFNVLDKIIPTKHAINSLADDYDNFFPAVASGNFASAALPAGWAAYTANASAQTYSLISRTDGVKGNALGITGTASAQAGYIGVNLPQRTAPVAVARSTVYSALGVRVIGPDGNQYVVTTTGTTAASAPTYNSTLGADTTDGTAVFTRYANFVAGDLVYAEAELFIQGVSGGNGGAMASVILQALGANSANEIRLNTVNNTDKTVKIADPIAYQLLRSRPFTLISAWNGWKPYLYLTLDNGTTGTLGIARFSIKHVVPPVA